MTDERFNKYQLDVLQKCFTIVRDTVNESYREKVENNVAESPYESAPAFWGMLTESVRHFDDICGKILNNDIEALDPDQFREVMFLVEILEHDIDHIDQQKSCVLRSGLNLLVGMFRPE